MDYGFIKSSQDHDKDGHKMQSFACLILTFTCERKKKIVPVEQPSNSCVSWVSFICDRSDSTLERKETMEEEGAANGRDVTIFLVLKSSVEEAAAHAKKKKRTMEQADHVVESRGAPEEKVFSESSRLRQCSKYFDTCMSGRWAMRTSLESSPSLMEFRLEVQTEPVYYHDCFSRMSFPFPKPIPDVVHCIQLLKVASHIEYHELMDICTKYLSAAPWSTDEEKQIREFYNLGHLSSDSTSDLCDRLRFPLTEEERKKETSTLVQRILSRYLKIALTKDATFELFDSRYASRQVFAEAFHALVSGCSGSTMCHDALQYALTIAKEELKKILVSMIGSGCQKGWGSPVVPVHLLQFCWLFEVLREANAAQVVVELLLKLDVSRVLLAAFDPYATIPSRPEIVYQWARMMYLIFQDVLGGRLFLTTSERVALYQQWNWILKKVDNFRPEEPPVSKVVASFIMSFPHLQQEEIYLRWASNRDEHPLQADYNLSQAHTMWMMSLVSSEVPKLEEKLTVSLIEHNVEKVEYLPRVNSRGSWDIL